jgi:dephospho-CoA kinase
MIVLGLTGGMGMGKSTAAAIFRRAGLPVFDADAEIHRMQARGGAALPAIEAAFPGTIQNGVLDRARLRQTVFGNPEALKRLEAILHPMVRKAERRFIARARRAGRKRVVLDIPLLCETGGERRVDRVIVVSAPRAVQIERLRKRRRMSKSEIEAVLARQLPDAGKRRRADYVVHTGLSRYHAQAAIRRLLRKL